MGISSIARAVGGGAPKPERVYILPLNIHKGDEPLPNDQRSFQYFPESLTDNKASNYQAKVIPGLSHPLYQWTSSGAREIAFDAVFTRDRALTDDEKKAIKNRSGEWNESNLSVSGAKYTDHAGPHYTTRPHDAFKFAKKDRRNVDIPSAVAWLRSFMDPEYTSDGVTASSDNSRRPFPPRKLILGIPGLRLNWGNPSLPDHEVYCIMVTCDVTYDAFFTDGTPRVARVGLSFNEIIQVGGGIKVQDAYNRRIFGLRGYRLGTDRGRGGGS